MHIEVARKRVADIGCPLLPGQGGLRCPFARPTANIHGNVQAKFRCDASRNFHCLIESAACQPGACQRHRHDQIRIGLFIQRLRQSGGKRSRAGKITAVLQSLDQYRGWELVREGRNDPIELRGLADAASASFPRWIGYCANRTMHARQPGQAVVATLAQALVIAAPTA